MNFYLLGFTIKDWLILVAVVILVFLIFKIRRLKSVITEEAFNRLVPQVGLIVEGDADIAFYIKNSSTTIAKNIYVEEINLDIQDFGFKIPIKVTFERVDS